MNTADRGKVAGRPKSRRAAMRAVGLMAAAAFVAKSKLIGTAWAADVASDKASAPKDEKAVEAKSSTAKNLKTNVEKASTAKNLKANVGKASTAKNLKANVEKASTAKNVKAKNKEKLEPALGGPDTSTRSGKASTAKAVPAKPDNSKPQK